MSMEARRKKDTMLLSSHWLILMGALILVAATNGGNTVTIARSSAHSGGCSSVAQSSHCSSSASSSGGQSICRTENVVHNPDGSITRTETVIENGGPPRTTVTTWNQPAPPPPIEQQQQQQEPAQPPPKPIPEGPFSEGDYIESEEEYESILRRFQHQMQNKAIKDDPRNFVDDDADVERFLSMIPDDSEGRGSSDQKGASDDEEEPAGEGSQQEEPRAATFDDSCPICQDSLKAGPVAMLNCGHLFHKHCVGEWKKWDKSEQDPNRISCPMCRRGDWFDPE